MDTITAKRNLMKLLCVNLDNYSESGIIKRYLQWHPDKNDGCKDYEYNLQLLKESYVVFTGKEVCSQHSDTSSTSAPFDSGCFSDNFVDDEEWDNSVYNQSPFDEEFLIHLPKKSLLLLLF
ncbi:hypothetical protein TNCT_666551 [Trichonephila clavata]|uniref:Uncharacterized protein n=1 Tax=Trichonephila clavata TaxID=2740835 RepID=A0A8X6GRR5_TRICU|nr:hypothetical protein TNCT_666551 [Trichonephila clavata]